MGAHKTRVLIVDDSATVRQTMKAILEEDPGIEVIATAADPFAAARCIQSAIMPASSVRSRYFNACTMDLAGPSCSATARSRSKTGGSAIASAQTMPTPGS